MKKFGTLLVSFSCLAGVAMAQNTPAPASVPTAVAAPVVAAPSAAQLALAQEVIKAMGADRQIEAMANQLRQMAAAQGTALAPAGATEAQKAAVAKMQASIQDLAAEATKNMTGALTKGFAEVFSTTELSAIKAFFSSPEGQAFNTKQADLSMRVGPQMRQFNEELRQKVGGIMQTAQQEIAPAPAAAASGPISATTPPIEVPAAATK